MNLGASESFWWAQVRLFPSRLIQGANILSRYHSPQALLVETCCLQHVHTMYKSIWPTRHARSQTHTWQWTHGYDYVCVFVCSTCTCMNATIFLLLIFWVHGTYPKQNAPQEWRNARKLYGVVYGGMQRVYIGSLCNTKGFPQSSLRTSSTWNARARIHSRPMDDWHEVIACIHVKSCEFM